MGNAGTLKVTLSANDAQFKAGIKSAANSVEGFRKSINKGHDSAQKFNAHMLAAPGSLRAFGAATGVSAGSLHHLVSAFEAAPGPIGAVLAAIILIKEGFNAQAEAANTAAEAVNKNLEMLKKFRDFKEGKKESADDQQTQALAADNKNLREKRMEAEAWNPANKAFNLMKWNPATMGLGFLGAYLTDRKQQIDEYKAAENRNRATYNDFKDKKAAESIKDLIGGSGGGNHTQSIGQRMGVFQVENGANQIDLLQQIANNTARSAADTNPVSNFQ